MALNPFLAWMFLKLIGPIDLETAIRHRRDRTDASADAAFSPN